MKVSERLALTEQIGRALQNRYTYREIDEYLAAYKISPPDGFGVNSKRLYARTALSQADAGTLVEIANDLGLSIHTARQYDLPENWKSTELFKLFISHISAEKLKAVRLKTVLVPLGISALWPMKIFTQLSNGRLK